MTEYDKMTDKQKETIDNIAKEANKHLEENFERAKTIIEKMEYEDNDKKIIVNIMREYTMGLYDISRVLYMLNEKNEDLIHGIISHSFDLGVVMGFIASKKGLDQPLEKILLFIKETLDYRRQLDDQQKKLDDQQKIIGELRRYNKGQESLNYIQ